MFLCQRFCQTDAQLQKYKTNWSVVGSFRTFSQVSKSLSMRILIGALEANMYWNWSRWTPPPWRLLVKESQCNLVFVLGQMLVLPGWAAAGFSHRCSVKLYTVPAGLIVCYHLATAKSISANCMATGGYYVIKEIKTSWPQTFGGNTNLTSS